LIEKTGRPHGFYNFGNYRLRIVVVAGGTRDYRR
jgi:hypothetical protein